ncbi:MAG: hypothetical protein ACK5XM_15460 [Betaproteobacteria bacterium]
MNNVRRVFIRREERLFSAHHMLLRAARKGLEAAEKRVPGYRYDILAAMTFSALAIEAVCNAVGEELIADWKRDFEACPPMTKLRVLCEHIGAEFDLGKQPWGNARTLFRFRNDIAHAKPELIKEEREVAPDFEPALGYQPESKLEKRLTIDQARTALATAEAIKNILVEKIPTDRMLGIAADGWHGSTTVHFFEDSSDG